MVLVVPVTHNHKKNIKHDLRFKRIYICCFFHIYFQCRKPLGRDNGDLYLNETTQVVNYVNQEILQTNRSQ